MLALGGPNHLQNRFSTDLCQSRFDVRTGAALSIYSLCPYLNVVFDFRVTSLTRFVENTYNIFIFKQIYQKK
jgi:hypothetical protein